MYHNLVGPYLGLEGQITPAEAGDAGIRIEGANKRMTLIQAAAKSTD